jgi:hypothetical protein
MSCPLTSTKIVICTITVAPPVHAGMVKATISRGGKLYARTRQHVHSRQLRLRLHLRHRLAKGRYALRITLLGAHGGSRTIVRSLIVT